ncbi:MAG: ribonuclease HII [Bacteroidales bacterium]|nr:ribonuclease HII [Bacteroidales bacterium]
MGMLNGYNRGNLLEAGCDEAGRGCLAGPVFAAAVILPPDYRNDRIRDSKMLTARQREELAAEIRKDALAWSVASADNREIDAMNILKASIHAMHKALGELHVVPEMILVDGNRFIPFRDIPHRCIIGGDRTCLSISAASILAKVSRDGYMLGLHLQHPQYGWDRNKGYPTPGHLKAIGTYGLTPFHRLTFGPCRQMKILYSEMDNKKTMPLRTRILK